VVLKKALKANRQCPRDRADRGDHPVRDFAARNAHNTPTLLTPTTIFEVLVKKLATAMRAVHEVPPDYGAGIVNISGQAADRFKPRSSVSMRGHRTRTQHDEMAICLIFWLYA
jgi:hypothetical protein